jgi:xanthine/CO dehydrogenase XdhC/CoxF family maturation factor
MTEHTHHHDEDPACAVAHDPVIPATSAAGERTLVAVFASPVAGYLLRYGADMGFRGLLLEPDEARAAGAAALGFPLLTAVPDDLDGSAEIARVHRPIGLNIGSRIPPEIAVSTLAGLLADRNGRPGGFDF